MNNQELLQSLHKAETQLLTGIKESEELTTKEKEMLFTFYTFLKYSSEIEQMKKKCEEYQNENQIQLERNTNLQNQISELQIIIDNEKRKKEEEIRKKKEDKMKFYTEKEDLIEDIKSLERKIEMMKESIEKGKEEVEKKSLETISFNERIQRQKYVVDKMKEELEKQQTEKTNLVLDADKMEYKREFYLNRKLDKSNQFDDLFGLKCGDGKE